MLPAVVLLTFVLSLCNGLPVKTCDDLVTIDDNVSPGYWSLKPRKVSYELSKKYHMKRDGDDYVSLSLSDQQTFYMADVVIGSDSQKVGVLLDTGSSDFWVVSSNNSYCEAGTSGSLKGRKISSIFESSDESLGDIDSIEDTLTIEGKQIVSKSTDIDCSKYGTFDRSSSSSFHSNGTSFSITYDDNTFAKGTWGQDTLTIGNIQIDNMNVAVCDNTDNAQGVLGIGLAGLEVTASNSGSNLYQYQNLPLKLVSDGIISKAAYSVFLDTSDNSEILFGAVDSSKYIGDLVELPIVNALYNNGINSPIQLTVTINSISYIDSNNSSSAQIGTGAIAALLDTGTTLAYMPENIVASLVTLLDLQYSSSLGYYIGECSIGTDTFIEFNFQGLELKIPLSSFFISLYTSSNQVSDQCAFGILSSGSESYITLGDSFLSNVYMVADLENLKIALAMGTNSNDSTSIDLISDSIPQAKQPQHSTTYGTVYNSFSVISTPTLSSTDLSSTSYSSSSSPSSSASSATSSSATSSSATSSSATSSSATSSSASSSAFSATSSSAPSVSASLSSSLSLSSSSSSSSSSYSSSSSFSSSSFSSSSSSSSYTINSSFAAPSTNSPAFSRSSTPKSISSFSDSLISISSSYTTSSTVVNTLRSSLSTSLSVASDPSSSSITVSSISSSSVHKNEGSRLSGGFTSIFMILLTLL